MLNALRTEDDGPLQGSAAMSPAGYDPPAKEIRLSVRRSKRWFDVFVTLFAAAAWVPVLVLTATALALLQGLPVFYISERRVGAGTARVPKFRTMVRDAERRFNRDTIPVHGDVRFLNIPLSSPLYTRAGRVVERFALTELPQLWLVLKGTMSLVGNRPLPENVMRPLREAWPDAEDRFLTPAGMTGPVQLVGREVLSDRDRLSLEASYCRIAEQHRTWRLDFLILLYTVLLALHLRKAFTPDGVKEWMARQVG